MTKEKFDIEDNKKKANEAHIRFLCHTEDMKKSNKKFFRHMQDGFDRLLRMMG